MSFYLNVVFIFKCAEEREVYIAVVAMIDEVGVVGERCFCAVFNDKKSVGVEVVVLEYQVGYVGDVLKLVWWIGKDKVERCLSRGEITKNILSHHANIVYFEVRTHFSYITNVFFAHFDGGDMECVARSKFVADRASAREEVEGSDAFDIHFVVDKVE